MAITGKLDGEDYTLVASAGQTTEADIVVANDIIRMCEERGLQELVSAIKVRYGMEEVKHYPLDRYYHPDEFKDLELIAKSKGFLLVSSSPLTRSSYHADEDFALLQKNRINQTNAQSIS